MLRSTELLVLAYRTPLSPEEEKADQALLFKKNPVEGSSSSVVVLSCLKPEKALLDPASQAKERSAVRRTGVLRYLELLRRT